MQRAPFPITSVIYTICDTCAHAVTYGDVSGVDPSVVDDVLGCIRVAGRLSYAGPTVREGFRLCEFCGTATNGTHHTFVGKTRP